MHHDSTAQRLDQILTTLTVLHLRIDLLQRRLARGAELRAADRQWLDTALGEIALSVRDLTALLGASGGVLETARNDVVANGHFDPPAPQPSLN
jgi:hypothetical protein